MEMKLNESQLRNFISKTVSEVLNEACTNNPELEESLFGKNGFLTYSHD